MSENEMMQAILHEMKKINTRLDSLEEGQKGMKAEMNDMKAEMNRRFNVLDRKIDRMGNDIGDTLAIITEATDSELNKLREAK